MGRPDTQMRAFSSLENLGEKRKAVAVAIAIKAGATLYELVQYLGWPVNRISGRVTELKDAGVIVDSGLRRINPTSGKNGIVWKVKGQAA